MCFQRCILQPGRCASVCGQYKKTHRRNQTLQEWESGHDCVILILQVNVLTMSAH